MTAATETKRESPCRPVIRAKVDGIKGAYILASAGRREDGTVSAVSTFFYDAGDVAAEWEPNYGPIQLWYRSPGEPSQDDKPSRPHYYYQRVYDRPLDWSQIAVEREGLPDMLIRGDTAGIFRVLRQWARRDEPSEEYG